MKDRRQDIKAEIERLRWAIRASTTQDFCDAYSAQIDRLSAEYLTITKAMNLTVDELITNVMGESV